jgi:DNA-binding GntR family transcriptional regulator
MKHTVATLPKLARDPLQDRVYDQVRRALMEGRLSPGQSLTVRGLAEQFGVSISPVRDALSALVTERALLQLDNGRIIVPLLSRASFVDVMLSRELLEGAATLRAAERISRDDLDALAKYAVKLDEAGEAGDITRYLELNRLFKSTIYAASGSPSLVFLLDALWAQVGPFLRFHEMKLRAIGRINFHHDVLAALRRGKGPLAQAAIQKDIRAGMQSLIEIEGIFAPDLE